MIDKRKIILILFTIIASIISYVVIVSTYPFDKDLETYAQVELIMKSIFVLSNIGIIVAIVLNNSSYKK